MYTTFMEGQGAVAKWKRNSNLHKKQQLAIKTGRKRSVLASSAAGLFALFLGLATVQQPLRPLEKAFFR